MGFVSVAELQAERRRLWAAIREDRFISLRDWGRILLLTEVLFARDVVGKATTTGLSDQETIQVLRGNSAEAPWEQTPGTSAWSTEFRNG